MMILNFWTGRPLQTPDPDQTSYRSSLIRGFIVCRSICTFWTNFSMVKTSSFEFDNSKYFGYPKIKNVHGTKFTNTEVNSAGLPRVREKSGKLKFFQGPGN